MPIVLKTKQRKGTVSRIITRSAVTKVYSQTSTSTKTPVIATVTKRTSQKKAGKKKA